jgi:predicted PurR-regulated permease PerM
VSQSIDDPVAQKEDLEEDLVDEEDIVEETEPREHRDWLGRPGRRFDRDSPFVIGLTATFGVAVAYMIVRGIVLAGEVLSLIAVALVIGIGLDPAVRFLTRRRLSRPWAVVAITLGFLAIVAGFVAAAVPPISHEISMLSHQIPHYRAELAAGRGPVGHLVSRFHLNNYFRSNRGGSKGVISFDVVGGVLGAGKAALSVVASTLLIVVLTVYFLAALPRIEATGLRLVPASRRERARLLSNEVFIRVGGFVLGNLVTSFVAGLGTFLWMTAFGLPYPLLLGIFVGFADLIPVVGSTVGGIVVSLVALSHSVPIALATAAFYIVYRVVEDYLLSPRVMARTVKVSPGITIIATLLGAALLGIVGALVAIPIAATIQLLLEEMAYPRMDRS